MTKLRNSSTKMKKTKKRSKPEALDVNGFPGLPKGGLGFPATLLFLA